MAFCDEILELLDKYGERIFVTNEPKEKEEEKMNAKKCDRCGNFYINGTADVGVTNVNHLYLKVYDLKVYVNTSAKDKDIDLCPECRHDLDEWFNKFKKEEEKVKEMKNE